MTTAPNIRAVWLLFSGICLFMASCSNGFAVTQPETPTTKTDTISLNCLQPNIAAGQYLYTLYDPTGTMILQDAREKFEQSSFSHNNSETLNLGYAAGDLWVAFTVEGEQCLSQGSWLLDLGWPHLLEAELHIPGDEPEKWSVKKAGLAYNAPDSVLPLHIKEHSKGTYYLRLRQVAGMLTKPHLRTRLAEAQSQTRKIFFNAFFYGLLGVMFAYNLFIFLALRDKSYLWYLTHLTFLGTLILFLDGVLYSLWPSMAQPEFIRPMVLVNFLIYSAAAMFSRSFLAPSGKIPIWLAIYGGIMAVLGVLSFVLPLNMLSPLAGQFGFITSLNLVICGIIRTAQGDKPARLFLLSWGIYLVFGCIHAATLMGIAPYSGFTANALRIGSGLEVTLLSFALAYRFRIIREERQRIERDKIRLGKENALLSLILDNSRLGICFAREGAIHWANNFFRDMFEITPGNEHGLKLRELALAMRGNPAWASQLSLAVVPESEGEFTRSDGTSAHYRLLGRAVPMTALSAAGERDEVWVVEDITEKKRLDALRQDMESISRHDLKSPLHTVIGLPEMIIAQGNLTHSQEQMCRLIEESGMRLLDTINLSLSLQRIVDGRFTPSLTTLDIMPVIRRTVREIEPRAMASAIGLHTATANGLPAGAPVEVKAEELLCHSMLGNLITNAVEAAPEGSLVSITVTKDSACRIIIRNQGEVPEEMRDSFFDKFVTKGKASGSGLGTYSARLFARAMNGDVHLDTSVAGETTVTVILPVP